MEIKATIVFQKNWQALKGDKRFIVNQGGSRSSKTYSLCQAIILHCLQNQGEVVSIVRKTFPALRATVMRDFVEVLREMNIYDPAQHNKTEHIYTFPQTGSIVEFFSVDDEQKIRGRKRSLCWANEANELWHDDFLQLNMRTTGKLIFDYNPSDADSWVYQLPIDDKVVIKSTYKDNPFLEKAIRRQIEDLKYTDEVLYQIYALGEQAVSRENVYTKWEELTERPDRFREYIYGLDFGYQHPTALIKVWYFENEIYVEEVIYESYLTAVELVKRMEELEVSYSKEILADYARPEMIAELRSAGYYVLNADKSVEEGISAVRMSRVYVDHNSKNIIKENRNYKHKKIKGEIRDKEIDKRWDDAMDAIRYAKLWIKKYSTDGISETLSLDI